MRIKAGPLLVPQIKVDMISETEYKLTGLQISQDNERYLSELIENFRMNLKRYKQIRFQINDTQKYFNRAFGRFPQYTFKPMFRQLNRDLKVKLRATIL